MILVVLGTTGGARATNEILSTLSSVVSDRDRRRRSWPITVEFGFRKR
ncbi:hypothetical protein ACLI4Q_10315 [Natrialbaceae archaeon A-CW1-1]